MPVYQISDANDFLDFDKHSVWLSPVPIDYDDKGTFYVPNANSFFFLGSNEQLTYSNTYNATLAGVYGKTSASAYFVDSSSGCVSTMSISTTRVQPPLDEIDDNSGNLNNISNARVVGLLRNMRGANTQLKQGAYVLRVGNIVMDMPHASENTLHGKGTYMEYYVFINDYTIGYEDSAPNILSISLSMTVRSPIAGYNLGTTKV